MTQNITNEAIAERIKQARIERGLTQKDLAVHLNKTSSNVSDIERCRVQVSAVDLYILAHALNKPIEYFFGEPWNEDELNDLIGLLRNETPEARQRSVEMMKVWLTMQTLQQQVEASDREFTPQEQQAFLSALVTFLVQFEQMKQQVDSFRTQIIEGLKELGIDLAAMLGGEHS